MSDDRFPSTHRTWLHQRLHDAGPTDQDLIQHLMARYSEPLQAYVQGSSLRGVGEPADLVNGFFAASLADATYLLRWIESGVLLRRWLMNGLILHARGLHRDASRHAARRLADEPSAEAVDTEPTAEAIFEEAWARRMLEMAVDSAGAMAAQRGKQRAFELFRRHVIEGMPYRHAVIDLGYSPREAKGVVRTMTQHVRKALFQALREEGIPETDLSAEAERLQRLIER